MVLLGLTLGMLPRKDVCESFSCDNEDDIALRKQLYSLHCNFVQSMRRDNVTMILIMNVVFLAFAGLFRSCLKCSGGAYAT